MAAAIEIDRLTRVYGRGRSQVLALDELSLTIHPGTVHALLGPNGAGKTTLVKILATVLLPTSGRVQVLGYDVVTQTKQVRPLIGIVFGGERGLYWRLTGRQNLLYWAALYGVPEVKARRRAKDLLQRVGLAVRADSKVETYSRGMKQQLHLARGLIADAQVLLLDEPTTGMDPITARDFRTLVRELRSEGRTILLTTHDMAEAEALSDRVALIDHGRLVAVEAPRTLGTWLARYERIDIDDAPDALLATICELQNVGSVLRLAEGGVRIQTTVEGATRQVLELLVAAGVTSIQTSLPSLEEVYVHMIGDKRITP